MADFISAGAIEDGLSLPKDALGHDQVAERLRWAAGRLPPGSVISLQGSWGRGKTDVLARLVSTIQADTKPEQKMAWLWINPWQYGTPDLLSPLVLALLERLSPKRRASQKALRAAARAVVLAGLNFGLKAATRTAPGGGLLLDAAESMNDMLGPLFDIAEDDAKPDRPDPDPVARMGGHFAALVDVLLEEQGADRLLVCVDDLDRCLPGRQVALLQAMRFLISSGARATFVVALDPTLARQALLAHYRSDAFDPDQYLDKMFTLRVNLPAVPQHEVAQLLGSHFARPTSDPAQPTLGDVVSAQLGAGWTDHLAEQASVVLCTPALRNPRLVRRIVDRLHLLLAAPPDGAPLKLHDPHEAKLLIGWLALGERWPAVRAALQSEAARMPRLWPQLHQRYTQQAELELGVAALDRLPPPSADQRQLFAVLGGDSVTVRFLQRLERTLRAAGL